MSAYPGLQSDGMETCADCGRPVKRDRPTGRWASRYGAEWFFTCRQTVEGARLLCADYHYVVGETQDHLSADPWEAVRGIVHSDEPAEAIIRRGRDADG